MGPSLAIRVENAVTIYDLVVFVLKKGKVELSSGEPLFQLLDELLRFVVAVDADRQNLDLSLLFFSQKAFQLPELLRAVGSPMAAVKEQDDILLAAKVGKGNPLTIHVLKSEIGRSISYLNPVKVRWFQIGPIFRAELPVGRGHREKNQEGGDDETIWKYKILL